MNPHNYNGFEIAVVGMSCRFPGARDVNQFWENLKNGTESVTTFSNEELREYGISEKDINDPKYVKTKGFLEDAEYFDASFFGLSPKEASIIDPQIRILAECSHHALEDAGYNFGNTANRVAVYVGAIPNIHWQTNSLLNGGNKYAEQFSTLLLSEKDFASTRLSYLLNLNGPSSTIYTACSTSLVSIDMACQSLLTGKSDLALAGGASLSFPYKSGYTHQEGMLMSKDGHTRSFDANATGTVWGDGVGVIVLKRLEDAINDGDNIHSIIKGTATNNDGNRKVGFSSPSVKGLTDVISEACQMAEVSPESITYLEGHGTATEMGDKIEISAFKEALKSSEQNHLCPIGSVKSNIGHLNVASGMAGFIKVSLMLKHGQIPPSINFNEPNSQLKEKDPLFYVNNKLVEWTNDNFPLRAGINSFGVGGTNAHVILEEAPEINNTYKDNRPPIICLSAKTPNALNTLSKNLVQFLESGEIDTTSLAYTLQTGRASLPFRKSVVLEDIENLRNALTSNYQDKKVNESKPIVLLFSDFTEFNIHTFKDLYFKEECFRNAADECFEGIRSKTTFKFNTIIDFLNDCEFAKASKERAYVLFAFEYALVTLLKSWGIQSDYSIGFSSSENIARYASGKSNLEEELNSLIVDVNKIDKTGHEEPNHSLANQAINNDDRFIIIESKESIKNNSKSDYVKEFIVSNADALFIDFGNGELADLIFKSGELNDEFQIIQLFDNGSSAHTDLLKALSALWESGITVDWKAYHYHEKIVKCSLPTYPFERTAFNLKIKDIYREDSSSSNYTTSQELPAKSKRTRTDFGSTYVAPDTDLEKKLAKIWEDFFGFEPVGTQDDFFQLGGDSLGIIALAANIQEVFDIDIYVRDLFKCSNFADQVDLIEKSLSKSVIKIDTAPDKPHYEIFSTQMRLFALYQMNPNSTAYNTPVLLKVEGTLDEEQCEDAFRKIIQRHEILRTSFHVLDGVPIQKIHNDDNFSVEHINILEGEGAQEILNNHVEPFDLTNPPLIRVAICKTQKGDSFMLLDVHHIVSDAASFELILREFEMFYAQGSLAPLDIQFKDYSEWLIDRQKDGELDKQKDFWMSNYRELPESLNLPVDNLQPMEENNNGSTIVFELEDERREKLQQLCQQFGVTMSTLTLTSFYILLSKLTGKEDIVIGTSTLGRWQRELKDLIGLFINTLAVRCKPDGNMKFLDFLGSVNEQVLDCLANEEYSYDQLLKDLELKSRSVDNQLFDVTFEYHNFDWSDIELPDGKLSKVDHPNMTSKFDLVLRVVERDDTCIFNLDYKTDLFKKETVERFATYYNRILDWLLEDVNSFIKDIEILSKEEKKTLQKDFNKTELDYDKTQSVVDSFAQQVANNPDLPAVIYNQDTISYQELSLKSTEWAKHLAQRQIKPGDVVGLIMNRSVDMIVAMFAVMKAGASYLPIDPNQPAVRAVNMLKDCNSKFIITNKGEVEAEFQSFSCISITDLQKPLKQNEEIILPELTADDLLYVIFTSGSTGNPKGVMMKHLGIINLINGLNQRVYLPYGNRNLKVALLASYSFDASAQQIFGALLQGHTLYITDDETRKNGDKLLSFYNDNEIDISDGTPTHFQFFLESLKENSQLKTLSSWILAGEILPIELVKLFYSKLGTKTQLYNFYGPTEACVDSVGYKINPEKLADLKQIPIGKPLPNERVYVTDHFGQIVPVGTVGELCIAGDGLAEGYVGDKELSLNKFSSGWITEEDCVYRTGDLARWLPDGNLEYYGRKDDHIKIRGHRIHLGEIEVVMDRCSGVQQSVVIVQEDPSSQPQLVAYFIAEDELDLKVIQDNLRLELPDYMVPVKYMQLSFFPMTSTGKIDKKALPEIEIASNYVEPKTIIEKQLVALWQELLGMDKVGVHDNFYELGGDSIKAIQFASRSKSLGIHIQVKDIFNHQTISEIIAHLKLTNSSVQETGVLSGNIELHPIQKHFFQRDYQEFNHYNQSLLLNLSKNVGEDALKHAVVELVKQHDILRAIYKNDENQSLPTQSYGSVIPDLVEEYVASLDDIAELCAKYQASLDLFKGEMIRFIWIKTPDTTDENRLLMVIHHLVVDGVSLRILTEDLANLLKDSLSGNKTNLPVKATSYRQWVGQLKEYAHSASLEKEYLYWKDIISNAHALPVDVDYQDRITYSETNKIRVSLSQKTTHKLVHDTQNAFATEINDILISALTMALSKWVKASKVVIALEGHGREELFDDMDINRTVGWFTSIFPVCLDLTETEDIGMLVADTKDMLREIPNKGIGFELLRLESNLDKIQTDLSIPYEELSFNYLGSFDNSLSPKNGNVISLASESSGSTVGRLNYFNGRISIDSIIVDGVLHLEWNYDTRRFHEETIKKLANSYLTALESIIAYGNQPLEKVEDQECAQDFEILSI